MILAFHYPIIWSSFYHALVTLPRGWCGGAKALRNFQCWGALHLLLFVGQGPVVLSTGRDGCFSVFFVVLSVIISSSACYCVILPSSHNPCHAILLYPSIMSSCHLANIFSSLCLIRLSTVSLSISLIYFHINFSKSSPWFIYQHYQFSFRIDL